MTTIELVIGQQATAALTVADAIPELQKVLTTLSDDVEAASSGFAGNASVGLAETLGAWFEVAMTLGPALEAYAQALVVVDTEHSTNEDTQSATYSKLISRLGGQ
jgi:hypothetical protein